MTFWMRCGINFTAARINMICRYVNIMETIISVQKKYRKLSYKITLIRSITGHEVMHTVTRTSSNDSTVTGNHRFRVN